MTISIISHNKENGHFSFFCQTKEYRITHQPKLNAMAQEKNNMFVHSVPINAFLVWKEEGEMLINEQPVYILPDCRLHHPLLHAKQRYVF